jgi:thioredoxin-dependent peroxiredoxin
MFHLKIGDSAPDFQCADENGTIRSLAEFRGKKLVLYFYPQDNTPTCTVEACNLRDNYANLHKKGYEILGVSPDSSKKHTGFRKKFDLPFSLLADIDLAVSKNYGIFGEKTFMGRTFDGIHRTTFVIDEQGKIERIISKVQSKIHAEQIVEV